MSTVCPTITAENPHVYREQIERIQLFADRIHIDLMDGIFTPNKSVSIEQVWWPENIMADIHVMYQVPEQILKPLLKIKPNMVVVHAESSCDVSNLAHQLHAKDVKLGLAIFANTKIDEITEHLQEIDQLLIFSGNLGYQGGSVADLSLLDKIVQAKLINPKLEIAWDGGVNKKNIKRLKDAGVDVINAGGAIHHASNPMRSYKDLVAQIS